MSFNDKQKQSIFRNKFGKCEGCNRKLVGIWWHGGSDFNPKLTFTILGAQLHHKNPKENGGSDSTNNIQLLCIPCHRKAHGEKSKKKYKEHAADAIEIISDRFPEFPYA